MHTGNLNKTYHFHGNSASEGSLILGVSCITRTYGSYYSRGKLMYVWRHILICNGRGCHEYIIKMLYNILATSCSRAQHHFHLLVINIYVYVVSRISFPLIECLSILLKMCPCSWVFYLVHVLEHSWVSMK